MKSDSTVFAVRLAWSRDAMISGRRLQIAILTNAFWSMREKNLLRSTDKNISIKRLGKCKNSVSNGGSVRFPRERVNFNPMFLYVLHVTHTREIDYGCSKLAKLDLNARGPFKCPFKRSLRRRVKCQIYFLSAQVCEGNEGWVGSVRQSGPDNIFTIKLASEKSVTTYNKEGFKSGLFIDLYYFYDLS